MDRTNTNQKNYRRANLEMGKGEHGFTRPLRDIFTGQTKEIVRPWHQKNWTSLPQQIEQRRERGRMKP
jgi:hypothetical protein